MIGYIIYIYLWIIYLLKPTYLKQLGMDIYVCK